jgi:hypothetical protein
VRHWERLKHWEKHLMMVNGLLKEKEKGWRLHSDFEMKKD